MKFPVENIARWIIARRIFVLIVVFTVTVLSIIEAGNIRINNNLEIWLERSSEEYSNYLDFTDDFGNDESIILLYHSDSLATNSHLKLNWLFTDSLRNISGVGNVISLATIKVPSSSLSGPSVLPMLPKSMSNPGRLKERLMRYRTYIDFLFSADFKTTSFVIIPDSVASRPAIIEKIESLANRYLHPAGEYVLFGVVPLKESLRTLSVNESGKFLAVTIFLLFFLSLLLFRRILLALLPLLIAILTIVWILGLMVATGTEMNIVTSILPIILVVISIANSIHFITGQIVSDRVISNRTQSVIHNFLSKYKKCFFSSVTTSVALFAFVFSDIIPLRQFGLFASIGVLLSFILTFAILPVIFSYFGSKADISHVPTKLAGSARFAELINGNRKAIFFTSAFLLVFAVTGITRIDVNTEQVTYFRKNHKIRIASEKASEWFAGVLPFELVFEMDTSFFLSPGDNIGRMIEFENKLGGMASVKS
ncbi:MAG: MMPL family transporter [Bacteroidales bacterium]|nr:MMPL family transporter [Bacteroidales bacterium]